MNAAPTSTAPTTAPVAPPRAWFADPKLSALTPLTVDPSGRVFGHLASWRECHMESGALGERCVTAPRSRTAYARFMLGAVLTAEGETVATGPIVMGAPHADPAFSLASALEHYGNSARAVADVRVGEDRHGIWIAGSLRPTVTPAQVRELRGSPLSGDWRTYAGHLELVAALAVNSPGFAIERPRALIASAGGMLAAVGLGLVPQTEATSVDTSDPRAFGLRSMRVRVEGMRRAPRPLRSAPQIERNLAEFDAYRRQREAREREHQHDAALVASLGLPSALVQPWEGPVGFEGVPTGDGRLIGTDALSAAAFPLALRWVPIDNGGHDGAVRVGRIDSVSRRDGGVIWAQGLIDLGQSAGREIARQIAGGFAGGISLDLDSTEGSPIELNGTTTSLTTSGRVRGATIVDIPAFSDARIQLVGPPRPGSEPDCGCSPDPTTEDGQPLAPHDETENS